MRDVILGFFFNKVVYFFFLIEKMRCDSFIIFFEGDKIGFDVIVIWNLGERGGSYYKEEGVFFVVLVFGELNMNSRIV